MPPGRGWREDRMSNKLKAAAEIVGLCLAYIAFCMGVVLFLALGTLAISSPVILIVWLIVEKL